jgi:hypothetical protein
MAREDKKVTYRNLLDVILALEEGSVSGSEVFLKIMMEYFFKQECDEKKFYTFIKGFDLPKFFSEADSIADIDIETLSNYINGNSYTDSLCGNIMLSKPYLKTFYQNHQPEFKKLPSDVQMDLIDKIKDKNNQILSAFHKMHEDREADRSRTILRLIALVLKNIQIRTGLPFASLKSSAEESIRTVFRNTDEVFNATKGQIAELTDDKNIKALIKTFFIIRRNQDLSEIAEHFRVEVERFKKRAEKLS